MTSVAATRPSSFWIASRISLPGSSLFPPQGRALAGIKGGAAFDNSLVERSSLGTTGGIFSSLMGQEGIFSLVASDPEKT